MSGECAARGIGNGARNHNRQFKTDIVKIFFYCEYGRFCVERIENSFDQNNIGAAFNQTIHRLQIIFDELIKGDVARTRIIYIGRNRTGAAGWPEYTGNKAWLGRIARGEIVAEFARKFGGGKVQLEAQVFHVVIGHGNARGVKGVGFQNVRTGFKISALDLADYVRFGDAEQIVIARDIHVVIRKARAAIIRLLQLVTLDHGAHTAIQNQDALTDGVM